jgi:hypothetical protein
MSLIEFVEGHAVPPRRPSAKKVRTARVSDPISKSAGKATAKKPAAKKATKAKAEKSAE